MTTQAAPRLYTNPSDTHLSEKKESGEDKDNLIDLNKMKPGARLRQAREQKNLSAQQVADRLYLAPNTINTLEADEYENLPSPVFVRGYLRNYAKLLDLSPESLVESYDKQFEQTQDSSPPLTSQGKQKKQVSSNDLRVKVVTAVIIIASLILMALWGVSSDFSSSSVKQQTVALPEHGNGEALAIPPQPTPAAKSPTTETTEYTPPPEEGAEADEMVASTPTNQPKSAQTKSTVSATGDVVPPITTTAKDTRLLLIHFAQEVQAEITDVNGEKLYNDKGKVGNNLSLKGIPPFKIKVNNTAGLLVEYKGRRFELGNAYRKGDYYIVGAPKKSQSVPAATHPPTRRHSEPAAPRRTAPAPENNTPTTPAPSAPTESVAPAVPPTGQ